MANIKFSDFTANGNIDGGAVPSPSGSETSFLVGFDSTAPTNNKWTLDQVAAGLPTLYAGDGLINEDRTITVGYPTADPKNTYVTTFESNKTVGTSNAQRSVSGTQIAIKETVNLLPPSYGQTIGAVLKLQHQNTGGSVNTEGYVQAFSVVSGSSDYSTRDQMGFRTNKAFVFKATDSSWPLYFSVTGGPSNNARSMVFSGQVDGGLLQLKAGNARTTKITLADTSSTPGTNGYYRYISGANNGNLILGRRLNGQSEEAYITCTGIGGAASAAIAVGINQSTPTETLHVTGNAIIDGQAYTGLHTGTTPLDPDWNNGNVQESTLTSGSSDFDPSNPKAGATYILKLTQPASGAAGTVNWDNIGAANIKWPGGTEPTLTATNGAVDIITLICTDSTGQGVYYANATLDMQ